MTKFFKKFKKAYFGAILGPFCANLNKNKFSWKKRFCQGSILLNIPIIYHRAKNQKKLMSHSEKNAELTNGQTGRQTTVIL